MRKSKINWSAVDWSKPNKQIVNELGVTKAYVSKKRGELAPYDQKARNTDWSNVDWSKSTKVLADELGLTRNYVGVMRKKYAPQTLYCSNQKGRIGRRLFEPVEFITPSGQKVSISNIREFVRNNQELFSPKDIETKVVKDGYNTTKLYTIAESALSMLKRGMYKSGTWKGWRLASLPDVSKQNRQRWKNVNWTKSTTSIAEELGVTLSFVSVMRAKYAPETRAFMKPQVEIRLSNKYDWTQIDWSKSNTQIAKELGAAPGTVRKARQHYAKKTVYRGIDWERLDWGQDNHTLALKTGRSVGTIAKKRSLMVNNGLAKPNHNIIDRRKATSKVNRYTLQRVNGEVVWKGENLYDFVRNNPKLFDPADVVWKNKVKDNPKKGVYCYATKGLLDVASGRLRVWKGWILRKKR